MNRREFLKLPIAAALFSAGVRAEPEVYFGWVSASAFYDLKQSSGEFEGLLTGEIGRYESFRFYQ